MLNNEEFPKEYFIEIDQTGFLLGRLTLHKMEENFSVEIDIVQSESRKIFKHVEFMHQVVDENEAVELAVQKLSLFIQSKRGDSV